MDKENTVYIEILKALLYLRGSVSFPFRTAMKEAGSLPFPNISLRKSTNGVVLAGLGLLNLILESVS